MQNALGSSGRDSFSVGAEDDRIDVGGVTGEFGQLFARLDVPELDLTGEPPLHDFTGARRQQLAVGRKRDARHWQILLRRGESQLARLALPETKDAIVAT